MFRFFAVVLVVGAFGATLYFSGERLGRGSRPSRSPPRCRSCRSRKSSPTRSSMPSRSSTRSPSRRRRPSKPSWLVELNAACRRGKRESESIPRPSTPQELARLLKESDRHERAHEPRDSRLVESQRECEGGCAASRSLRPGRDPPAPGADRLGAGSVRAATGDRAVAARGRESGEQPLRPARRRRLARCRRTSFSSRPLAARLVFRATAQVAWMGVRSTPSAGEIDHIEGRITLSVTTPQPAFPGVVSPAKIRVDSGGIPMVQPRSCGACS